MTTSCRSAAGNRPHRGNFPPRYRSRLGGEAQGDAAVGRVEPAGGDDLASGEEVDALAAVGVGVAEQGRLPAAEGVVRHRDRDRYVDADHADLHLVLEAPGGA